TRVDTTRLKIPDCLKLADEEYYKPGVIEVLIGADTFWQILQNDHIDLLPGQPRIQSTSLGWILGGRLENKIDGGRIACNLLTNEELSQQLERFWQPEEVNGPEYHSQEEQLCENHFKTHVQRNSDGRFIVALPRRDDIILGDSYKTALKRLLALERRFERQPEIKRDYVSFMQQYKKLGHMSQIEENRPNRAKDIYYLPHQPVIKSNALTSKLRVVFDASARSESGVSLNHKLIAGPVLQDTLFELLLKFRLHQYVMTADLEMMYRQILVREQDRNLQRILWRASIQEEIQIYCLNTLTYGAHTMEEACLLQQQLMELLKAGGFNLRKWRSNNKEILSSVRQYDENEFLVLNKHEIIKTLGLRWNAEHDYLQYEMKVGGEQIVTKRQLLSLISKIYDPLGLIGPILVIAKQLMQRVWKEQLDWDEELPDHLHKEWLRYHSAINSAQTLVVPRNVNPGNVSMDIEVHIFCDASEKAYGACAYACHQGREGSIAVQLMCSKSRVAPLKSITLPRLELNAAHLAAKLFDSLERTLGERIRTARFWTDSMIVLSWIRTETYKLKTYVANRVSDIQQITAGKIWSHVPSKHNPTDLLSRGISTKELRDNRLWWHGPQWLTQPEEEWPSQRTDKLEETPELRREVVLTAIADNHISEILKKYSSISKLKRVIAYCMRFGSKLRGEKKNEELTIEELERAMLVIVRLVQDQAFKREINELRLGKAVHRKSKLLSLRPFLDKDGLLRVGGRLRQAEIEWDQKHPLLLPAKHYITTLIFQEEHRRLLHCGPEQLLASIRLRYWPIVGRQEARKITRHCIECFRFKPKVIEAVMADLPKDRLQGCLRPFAISGVDYAGPIQIREGKRRGRIPISKGYIALFVCFNTKAVHLEAVTNLTTEAFLAALRRFTARRGLCRILYSDNAKNFVGASRELKEVHQFMKDRADQIKTGMVTQGIEWKFIPPRSPNFGGLWEAAVKATKRHLYIATRNLILTYEELSTLLAEIESILNSRPLTPLSSHPNDLTALTPAHFLLGDSQSEPMQKNLLDVSNNAVSRWQHQQKIKQHFWIHWKKEYLHQLQMRTKWYHDATKLEPEAMVIMMDEQTPPLKWALARILESPRG
ncbi:PREDICTED: uncharacterized protein LOC108766413, partial [Trachymyrmex cornetzi]|uniref:uncharacterized protein LOC108766413 n=1 Tax=Trachymyrmex cornetzi TaxID=471704 RepID=UPI00084F016C